MAGPSAQVLKRPQRGEATSELWKYVIPLIELVERQQSELRHLTDAIADLRGQPKRKTTGGAGGGITFYGEWANQAFPKDALVVIRGGISAGLYISVEPVPMGTAAPANPPADPTQAGPWVMLAPGNVMGLW